MQMASFQIYFSTFIYNTKLQKTLHCILTTEVKEKFFPDSDKNNLESAFLYTHTNHFEDPAIQWVRIQL